MRVKPFFMSVTYEYIEKTMIALPSQENLSDPNLYFLKIKINIQMMTSIQLTTTF